jgi:hypothetical protein
MKTSKNKKEKEIFLSILKAFTKGRDKDDLVAFSDEVAGLTEVLDDLVAKFLGTNKPNISDFELQSLWKGGKTIKEFKNWLKKENTL